MGSHFNDPKADQIPIMPGSAFIPKDLPDDCAAKFADPSDTQTYFQISVSDDGTKVLLCDEQRGVMLLARIKSERQPRLHFPSVELCVEEQMQEFWEDDEEFSTFIDMIHAALSPDGGYVALGNQDDGHHLLRLNDEGQYSVFAHLDPLASTHITRASAMTANWPP